MTNPLQPNPSASLIEHAYDYICDSAKASRKKVVKQIDFLGEKINLIRQRYLNCGYVRTKTMQVIRAKICPCSKPPGFEKKTRKVEKIIVQFQKMKTDRERSIEQLTQLIDSSPPKQHKEIKKTLDIYIKQQEIFNETLKRSLEYKKFLTESKSLQIQSRFIGFAGNFANALAPGSSTIVGLALNGAAIAKQKKLSDNLSTDLHLAKKEKDRTCNRTLIAIASTVGTAFLSTFAIPAIKNTARYLWESLPT